jgi:hypothetical protein
MAKAKKSKAKKSKAKKTKKTKKTKKPARAQAKAKVKAKKSKKPVKKAAAKKPAPKKPVKKQVVGEGDYAASRAFLKDEADFVARNRSKIPAMGKAAEAAMEGPEGATLRAAEEEAKSRSKSQGPEE